MPFMVCCFQKRTRCHTHKHTQYIYLLQKGCAKNNSYTLEYIYIYIAIYKITICTIAKYKYVIPSEKGFTGN